jgi:tripartite-type tricarboxylate transporter receptor subunit TctC
MQRAVVMLCAGMMAMSLDVASGQNYPTKPIRIVTAPPGGANDLTARVIAQGISSLLGQQVVVDNRPTAITGTVVFQAPPDGYTLLLAASSFTIGSLMRETPYDVVRDFSPITLAASSPGIVVVHPSVPVKTIKELTSLAKARPGQLNYGSGAIGSASHLAAVLFKSMAGVSIERINYKGAGPALTDMISGQVQLMFATASGATPHIKSGRLRALAVTSSKPSALAPGLPTVAASGVPGYESTTMLGLFAHAQTPEQIINRLNQEIVRVVKQPDVQRKFLESGTESVGNSPEEFASVVRAEIAMWSKMLKTADIRAE